MANHCSSTLRFVLPHDEEVVESFLNAIKGPQDWFFPVLSYDTPDAQTAHERLAQEHALHHATPADIRAELSQRLAAIGGASVPDWMPICMETAIQVLTHPHWLSTESVPLSFPRLLGPFDEETYLRALLPRHTSFSMFGIMGLPSLPTGDGAVLPTPLPTDRFVPKEIFQAADLDIIGMVRSKIGVKWTPNEFRFDEEEDVVAVGDRRTLVTIAYTTPWAPVSSLREALWDVLLAHRAKVLCWWDAGDGTYGSELLDPSQDRHETWDIELVAPSARRDSEEDDDGAPDTEAAQEGDDDEDDGFEDDGMDGDDAFYENIHVYLEEKAVDYAGDDDFRA